MKRTMLNLNTYYQVIVSKDSRYIVCLSNLIFGGQSEDNEIKLHDANLYSILQFITICNSFTGGYLSFLMIN